MGLLDPQSLPGHVDRLYRAAWALCGSSHEAEDLVQETFVRVLARPRMLRAVGTTSQAAELAYLMRVLRNTFLNSRRSASRRPQVSATLEQVDPADPRAGEQAEQALEAQELYAAIAELPEDFRLALVAVDVLGLSYAQAGRALGAPEATITTRLHRARRRVVASVEPPTQSDDPDRREGSTPPRGLA
ncbi:MAG: RNA polymerase sigma factor [Solirubrobacteraceae bacterium]|jgi:RNA polymerase sigma-70 factor (ECF subfamily)